MALRKLMTGILIDPAKETTDIVGFDDADPRSLGAIIEGTVAFVTLYEKNKPVAIAAVNDNGLEISKDRFNLPEFTIRVGGRPHYASFVAKAVILGRLSNGRYASLPPFRSRNLAVEFQAAILQERRATHLDGHPVNLVGLMLGARNLPADDRRLDTRFILSDQRFNIAARCAITAHPNAVIGWDMFNGPPYILDLAVRRHDREAFVDLYYDVLAQLGYVEESEEEFS